MNFIQTDFPGLVVIEPSIFYDKRGYFFETHNLKTFSNNGQNYNWVQDNQSLSSYGVIRGLHFQSGKWAQAKLVRCLHGNIIDVAVDLRPSSPTFKKYFSIELTSENKKMMLIPRGFAHGFSVISEEAEIIYKCDNYYNSLSDGGIIYNDESLNINWRIDKGHEIVSEKDLLNRSLDYVIENQIFLDGK